MTPLPHNCLAQVRKLNLIVPMAWQQQPLLVPSAELERALTDFERLADEQREAALERARRQALSRRLRALRAAPHTTTNFWGFGASFAVDDAAPMPSMFTALREVLMETLTSSLRGGTTRHQPRPH